ncbi:HIT domain-containing protein [Nocardia cyriacigeorgica]|uniref:HIT family protein n=1 Tax=Nocardia cyriacigeorgica TaxID=135487 RepID=UPI0018948E32|nr:HIT domain-containing protein [Nocardia cyriacigeorgica]MBF6326547.1 HIT domain-containing protein [Nocardia cyriacigeorgica]
MPEPNVNQTQPKFGDAIRDAFDADTDPASEYYSKTVADPNCPFCQRIDANDYEQSFNAAVVRFEPLNPVTPGHMLFVPTWHVEHPSGEAVRLAMGYAETYASRRREAFNLITSSGAAATQTVPHLHVHYVPRRDGDGLHLPWTGQKRDYP